MATATTPDARYPCTAAVTAAATSSGSSEGEREPIVGSWGPIVTSASGANTQVNPRPRSCSPVADAASVTTAAAAASSPRAVPPAIAAPADMKVGKSVATGLFSRATTPPSWSTVTTAGQVRPSSAAACCTAAAVAVTCSASTTLSPITITPARCSSRTRVAGVVGSVPS